MTTLRNIKCWLCAVAVVCGLSACSGNSEEEPPVKPTELDLQHDKTTIEANGAQVVTFTVLDGKNDVTADATIRCTSHDGIGVSDATFSTTVAGTYVFEAVYGEKTSPKVTITATKSEQPDTPSKFVRKVCLMEFTGQWCAMCPAGYNYMWYIVSRNYAETVHILALHDNSSGEDEMAIPVQREVFSAFKLTGYPSAVIDMRDSSPLNNDSNGTLKKSIESSLKNYPAHCGVAVSSAYDEAAKKATVTVKLHSERGEEYRLALWVVEDDIVAKQNVGGTYSDEYTHNHVARRLISANWQGDRLGQIAAGQETSKKYEIEVDAAWNLDNTSVYALAIDAEGHVNNMAVCALKNGNTDYEYVSE